MFIKSIAALTIGLGLTLAAQAAPTRKLLFFTKSSGFEHSVISWKTGRPSLAEKVFIDIGEKNTWEFEFSKDGSKFSPEYLAGFDAVIFYTSGDLTQPGNDKQPPMTPEGKQALLDYVKSGKGFIGLHSASDTFHTNPDQQKGPDSHVNHGDKADPYICMLGGEFISHGAQQVATNRVINPKFPGFEKLGVSFAWNEEWYSLKEFRADSHCLTVIDAKSLTGDMYQRPDYPTSWARQEGKGRVFYTAMGHRDDIWTNPQFQDILVGAIQWATGDVKVDITPNLKEVAPGAMTNPEYREKPKPQEKKAKKEKKADTQPAE